MVSPKNHRSKWELRVVESLIKSHDGIVKGAQVRVIVKEKPKTMERSGHLYPQEIRAGKSHMKDPIADSMHSSGMDRKETEC